MSQRLVQILGIFLLFNFITCENSETLIENIAFSRTACHIPENIKKEIAAHQETVNKIMQEITEGQFKGKTWDSLAELTDTFGPRMSCTQPFDSAIDYVVENMKKAGLENVHTEDAEVPSWTRGYESAKIVKPWKKEMRILGLGSSIGTEEGGITADVIAVESFDEFQNISEDEVFGKIVVFVPKWDGYKKTAPYRRDAASVASRKGAVAALVRSITPFSIGSPHTGQQDYAEGVKKIPVASITVEDAEMILRMYKRKQNITIQLEMAHFNNGTCISRNTVGELQGTKYVNESVVVVSGHLDSWDVGVGGMDDGGGSMISWKAIEYLKAMKLRPKRTIRAVLWTSEEQGLVGAQRYMEAHQETEEKEFNFFMESDSGTFEPRGFDFSGNADASCILREISKLMTPINATEFSEPAKGGPDISVYTLRGFPSASLLNKNERYFWFHHTDGDSMNVWEDKSALDKCVALWAATSYVIADLSINIPRTLVKNEIP